MPLDPILPPRPDVSHPAAATTPRRRPGLLVGSVCAIVSAIVAVSLAAAPSAKRAVVPIVLVSPSAHPDADGDYAFLDTTYDLGRRVPVRWDPCHPIQYQVSFSSAPRGALASIQGAVSRASEATGIPFSYDGPTGRTTRALIGADFRSDARDAYAPVLISVVSTSAFHHLRPPRRAVAFAHAEPGEGPQAGQWVAGFIVINGGLRYPHRGRWSFQLVVLHELGHLLGLAHVRAPDELMFSNEVAPNTIPRPIDGWGPGDLEGLAKLGSGQGCLDQIDVAP